MDDSTNLQAPYLGPTWPLYPEIPDVVHVSGPAVGGTNPAIYPCFNTQWVPGTTTLRDREPSYVFEPNNVALTLAYYDSRLVGNYNGLPLYATTCCPPG